MCSSPQDCVSQWHGLDLIRLCFQQETHFQSLGWEDPLEKGKATQSSILAWRIHSPRGCKESDTTEQLLLSLFSFPGLCLKVIANEVFRSSLTLLVFETTTNLLN